MPDTNIKWEILVQDCNGQGYEFNRGTGIYIEAACLVQAVDQARKLCCAADPKFISVRRDDTEPKTTPAPCTARMIRSLFVEEPAAKAKDWQAAPPIPCTITLAKFNWERGIIRRPGPGTTELIEPDINSERCSFTFEIEDGDIKLQKTIVLPAAEGGERLIKALAQLTELHHHAKSPRTRP